MPHLQEMNCLRRTEARRMPGCRLNEGEPDQLFMRASESDRDRQSRSNPIPWTRAFSPFNVLEAPRAEDSISRFTDLGALPTGLPARALGPLRELPPAMFGIVTRHPADTPDS